jgi:hypothetical protein
MDTQAMQREWLGDLDRKMRREIAAQRAATEELWAQALAERVRDGRSLGPLDLAEAGEERVRLIPASRGAASALCSLREGDFVRLSHPHTNTRLQQFLPLLIPWQARQRGHQAHRRTRHFHLRRVRDGVRGNPGEGDFRLAEAPALPEGPAAGDS